MNLNKFCIFFERSNSRGIQLNFTDILAAKLYHGFNLRQKIEEFESQSKFRLNREVIVRTIAYLSAADRKTTISIDKKFILENLDASDFQKYWELACKLFETTLNYLATQYYILSQDWIPSENIVIPIMLFLHEIKGFDRMTQEHKTFLEYWFWASVFSNRYSTSSNEFIIADCAALIQIAKGNRINQRGYFNRLRPRIQSEDLFNYTKKTSAVYKGVLNLLAYAASGLKDWNSKQLITSDMKLEDHHIYSRAYISSAKDLDLDPEDAEQLVDCVVNRTLIPKILNIQIGKKPPQVYLHEISLRNPGLSECLNGHLIPEEIISNEEWNKSFKRFLMKRSEMIYSVIKQYAVDPASEMEAKYSVKPDKVEQIVVQTKMGLKEMLKDGRIKKGDRVFFYKNPEKVATIVSGNTVEFEGRTLSMNLWGQQISGWRSINIYSSLDKLGLTRQFDERKKVVIK